MGKRRSGPGRKTKTSVAIAISPEQSTTPTDMAGADGATPLPVGGRRGGRKRKTGDQLSPDATVLGDNNNRRITRSSTKKSKIEIGYEGCDAKVNNEENIGINNFGVTHPLEGEGLALAVKHIKMESKENLNSALEGDGTAVNNVKEPTKKDLNNALDGGGTATAVNNVKEDTKKDLDNALEGGGTAANTVKEDTKKDLVNALEGGGTAVNNVKEDTKKDLDNALEGGGTAVNNVKEDTKKDLDNALEGGETNVKEDTKKDLDNALEGGGTAVNTVKEDTKKDLGNALEGGETAVNTFKEDTTKDLNSVLNGVSEGDGIAGSNNTDTKGDLNNALDQNSDYCFKVYDNNPWHQFIHLDEWQIPEQLPVVDVPILDDLEEFLESLKMTPILDPEVITAVLGIDLATPPETYWQCGRCLQQFQGKNDCQQHMEADLECGSNLANSVVGMQLGQ